VSYRYLNNSGSTARCLLGVSRHLHKVGEVKSVEAYDYHTIRGGVPVTNTRVKVKGTLGYAAFIGLNFGYGGKGPHGTRQLLTRLGVPNTLVDVPLSRVGYKWQTPTAKNNVPIMAWTLHKEENGWRLESTQKTG
jgi:hypothetical protein